MKSSLVVPNARYGSKFGVHVLAVPTVLLYSVSEHISHSSILTNEMCRCLGWDSQRQNPSHNSDVELDLAVENEKDEDFAKETPSLAL